jgi:hypothetical protein
MFHITQYLSWQVFYQVHQSSTFYRTEAVRSVYCYDQVEVFLKDANKILLIIQVRIQETEALLSGVGPCCINTWIPCIQDHRLITLKVLRNIIPELFRKSLLSWHHILLTEEEYLWNDIIHDCSCRREERQQPTPDSKSLLMSLNEHGNYYNPGMDPCDGIGYDPRNNSGEVTLHMWENTNTSQELSPSPDINQTTNPPLAEVSPWAQWIKQEIYQYYVQKLVAICMSLCLIASPEIKRITRSSRGSSDSTSQQTK